MKRLLLPLLLVCASYLTYAQPAWMLPENANWKFYQFGGLDFVNNLPVADSSSMSFIYNGTSSAVYAYSSASVSDAHGDLLFYTDAYNVWDKNDQPMPNGNNLLPGNAIDGAFILPDLNNHDQYYIFYMSGTIDFGGASSNAFQLRYSKVDMSLNNGSGDVVSGQKNIIVAENLSGQMKAVPGDDCNIWLITHDLDSAQFKVFEITVNGLNTAPVVSNAGNGYMGFMGPLSFLGHMNVSHDRTRIALAQYGGDLIPLVELFDFDPATATVSNAQVIDTLTFINYNLCFSPDNSRLYLTMNNPNINDWHVASSLFQYDLNAGTTTDIMNSKTLISDSISSVNVCMRIGPDGKIYLPSSYGNDTSAEYNDYNYGIGENPSTYPGAPDFPFHAYLGCIQNPDALGANCNFDRHAIALSAYSSAAETLGGEFVKPIPGDSLFAQRHASVCKKDGNVVLEVPDSFLYYEWNDGGTNNQKTVDSPGVYWVRYGDYCHYRIDTFTVNLDIIDANITVNGFVLGTAASYETYQWLFDGAMINGATDSVYTVTQNGDYAVIVTSEGGCVDTSGIYTVTNVGIGESQVISDRVNIYPNPGEDWLYIQAPQPVNISLCSIEGKTIKEIKDASQLSVKDLSPGIYFIRITDKHGMTIKTEKWIKQ